MTVGLHLGKIALGTIGYTVSTFTLAVVWHVVLFEERYIAIGYFDGEPNFALGLVSIFIQGATLSALFPLVRLRGSAIARGLKYSAVLGVFFWTSHVLAFLAKVTSGSAAQFTAMETVYLALQFGLFGLIIGLIHRRGDAARLAG